MKKIWENNGTEENGLVTPTPGTATVIGGWPSQRAGNTGFDVYFEVSLNKRLNKPSSCRPFDVIVMLNRINFAAFVTCQMDGFYMNICYEAHPGIDTSSPEFSLYPEGHQMSVRSWSKSSSDYLLGLFIRVFWILKIQLRSQDEKCHVIGRMISSHDDAMNAFHIVGPLVWWESGRFLS